MNEFGRESERVRIFRAARDGGAQSSGEERSTEIVGGKVRLPTRARGLHCELQRAIWASCGALKRANSQVNQLTIREKGRTELEFKRYRQLRLTSSWTLPSDRVVNAIVSSIVAAKRRWQEVHLKIFTYQNWSWSSKSPFLISSLAFID